VLFKNKNTFIAKSNFSNNYLPMPVWEWSEWGGRKPTVIGREVGTLLFTSWLCLQAGQNSISSKQADILGSLFKRLTLTGHFHSIIPTS
jgi:hypothetical protein